MILEWNWQWIAHISAFLCSFVVANVTFISFRIKSDHICGQVELKPTHEKCTKICVKYINLSFSEMGCMILRLGLNWGWRFRLLKTEYNVGIVIICRLSSYVSSKYNVQWPQNAVDCCALPHVAEGWRPFIFGYTHCTLYWQCIITGAKPFALTLLMLIHRKLTALQPKQEKLQSDEGEVNNLTG